MNRKQNENEINLDTAKQMVMNELKQILTFEENKSFNIFKFVCSFDNKTIDLFFKIMVPRFEKKIMNILFEPYLNQLKLIELFDKYLDLLPNINMNMANKNNNNNNNNNNSNYIPYDIEKYIIYLENKRKQYSESVNGKLNNNNNNNESKQDIMKLESNYIYLWREKSMSNNEIKDFFHTNNENNPIFAIDFSYIVPFFSKFKHNILLKQGFAFFNQPEIICKLLAIPFKRYHENKMKRLQIMDDDLYIDEVKQQLHGLIRYVKHYAEQQLYPNVDSLHLNNMNLIESLYHFPPCMRDCISNLKYLKHNGRFQLILFLSNIGFNIQQIHAFWKHQRKPNDFAYQVQNIHSKIKRFMTCEKIESNYGCFWKKYKSEKCDELLKKWYGENDYSYCIKKKENKNLKFKRIICKDLFAIKNWDAMRKQQIHLEDIEARDRFGISLTNAKNLFIASVGINKKTKPKITIEYE